MDFPEDVIEENGKFIEKKRQIVKLDLGIDVEIEKECY